MRYKEKKSGRTAPKVLLALVLIIAIAVVGGYFVIKNYDKAVEPNSAKTVDFEVPKGASTTKIAALLKEAGLIKNDTIFKLKSKLCGYDGKYQAGQFELSPSMTTEQLMVALQDAHRETQKITIKEGWSLTDIANYLEENKIVSKSDFYASLENDEFDQWFIKLLAETAPSPNGEISKKANRFEGFLFPDTYEIYVGSSARYIINKMLNGFAEKFDDELKDLLDVRDLTLQQAITIASIIEGETVVDKERPLVSSVIYNRLNSNATGKLLQMDATILYALGEHKTRVLYKDLEIDSPYNTYKRQGLPIGPINSPGIACIKAALNPADTDYLYYVANSNGDGSHKFTSSYSQHQNNSSEYHNSQN